METWYPKVGQRVRTINGFGIETTKGRQVAYIKKGTIGTTKKIETIVDVRGNAVVKVKFPAGAFSVFTDLLEPEIR